MFNINDQAASGRPGELQSPAGEIPPIMLSLDTVYQYPVLRHLLQAVNTPRRAANAPLLSANEEVIYE